MLALIILSLGISRSFSSPILPILKSASELENEDGIIIQPIRNENIQPQLCVLSFPFNTTTGGKMYSNYSILAHWSCSLFKNVFLYIKAESFYTVKNGSSIITSKSLSKNFSNENKHTLCFQSIGIFIHFLSWRQQKHQCLFSLLRFFEQLFDVIIDDPFLTL